MTTDSAFGGIYMPLTEAGPNPARPQVDRAMWDWLDAHGLCAADEARENLRHTDVPGCIALYYPHAGPAVLSLITRFTGWALLVDDSFDAGPVGRDPDQCAQCAQAFLAALDHDRRSGPMTAGLADLWSEIRSGRSTAWRTAFRADFARWLWGFHAEAADRATHRRPGPDDYLEHRRYMFGVPYYLRLAELAAEVDLPEPVRRLPSMIALLHAAADATALCNDLASAPREAVHGYYHNAVLLTVMQDDLPRDEAAERVIDLMNARTRRLQTAHADLSRQLRATQDEPQWADGMRYADTCLAMVRGNYDYHRDAVRYAELAHVPASGPAGYAEDLD